MKWGVLFLILTELSACAWLQPGVVRDRDVLVTDPPNKLLEPFMCGDNSIDVTETVKKCP